MRSTPFEQEYAKRVKTVEAALAKVPLGASRMGQAARYSLCAGGKRLRPILLLEMATQGRKKAPMAMAAALAVEMIHTFSLIHDDMPCIDNSDLRRGRPSCHKAYDEATALLAGDLLLNAAYRTVSRAYTAAQAGVLGAQMSAVVHDLIEGEYADVQAESLPVDQVDLDMIYMQKTARMIGLPVAMGLTLAGYSAARVRPYVRAAHQVGIAFQIVDDLLDERGDPAKLGKNIAQDAKKKTYLKQRGPDWCVAQARRLSTAALRTFAKLPRPEFTVQTIQWLLQRDR